jgi:hypothetical protein
MAHSREHGIRGHCGFCWGCSRQRTFLVRLRALSDERGARRDENLLGAVTIVGRGIILSVTSSSIWRS